MEYLKRNKELLIKYLLIMVSNILLYILSSYYFKNFEYGNVIMFLLLVVIDLVIYYYRGTQKFKIYLDFLCCFILGLIMLLFDKEPLSYAYVIFNFFFANNIVFMISRKSKNIFRRGLQYILVMFLTLLYMILNLVILYFILY